MGKEQKKLQNKSEYAQYDLDGDGVVSDVELSAVTAMHEQETIEEKADAQRHMAWVALVSMLVFTVFVFLPIVPDARVQLLGNLSSLFYVSMAGVVGAYMGFSAMKSNGKNK